MKARIQTLIEWVTGSAMWKSVFRHGYPDSEKNRSLVIVSNFFLHLHPVKVKAHGLKLATTMGLGGLSLLLFAILTVTGILLMFWYVPSVDQAYGNMKDLEFVVSYGWIMRNMHRWAAHAMVAVVFLHMCRVFFTGAYKRPRQFNWVIGVGLFGVTLGLSYTGYLLPWDQLAYWAVVVGTNIASATPFVGDIIKRTMLGGNSVGQSALLRFYVLHCVVLPLTAVLLMGIHFWRIRKDGGIASPAEEEEDGGEPVASAGDAGGTPAGGERSPKELKSYGLMALVRGSSPHAVQAELRQEKMAFTWPHLVFRELIYALVVINILLVFSMAFNAPLEEPVDATRTPTPAKAPWYFTGLQELVASTTFSVGGITVSGGLIGGVIVPGLIAFVLVAIPYIDRNPKGIGRWFAPERKRATILFGLFILSMVVLILIGTFCRGPGWHWYWPWESWPIH